MKRLSKMFMASVVVMISTLLLVNHTNAAGTASLSLSPASQSIQNGNLIVVEVRVNTSDQINTVQADLTYDASKLEFQSINASGSAFDTGLPSSGGAGSVAIARGVSAGGTVTGSLKIASVTFKALVSSGSTNVTFANSSLVIRPSDAEDVWNGNTTGGTYTFTAPPASPTPTPAPSPTPTPTPSSTPTASPTTSPTSSGGSSTAQQSSQPSTSPVSTQASASQPTASNPQGTIPDDQPVPTLSTNADPNDGYLVAIQVFDKNKKGAKDIEVMLGDKKAKTDDLGVASFTGIANGTYRVEVAGATEEITVNEGDPSVVQDFSISLGDDDSIADALKDKTWYILIPAGILLLILVLVASNYKKISFKLDMARTARESKKNNANVQENSSAQQQSTQVQQRIEPTTIQPTVDTSATDTDTAVSKE